MILRRGLNLPIDGTFEPDNLGSSLSLGLGGFDRDGRDDLVIGLSMDSTTIRTTTRMRAPFSRVSIPMHYDREVQGGSIFVVPGGLYRLLWDETETWVQSDLD